MAVVPAPISATELSAVASVILAVAALLAQQQHQMAEFCPIIICSHTFSVPSDNKFKCIIPIWTHPVRHRSLTMEW